MKVTEPHSDYLKTVYRTGGASMTQAVLDYVLLVWAKNLMMVTHVHITNCEEDKVEEYFDLFNQHY